MGSGLGGVLIVGVGTPQNAAVQNNNTSAVTFVWNVSIPSGANVTATFKCTQRERNNFTVRAFFTPPSSPTDSPSLGWRVEPSGRIFLTNGYQSAIAFEDLRFQFPSEITIDSMFDLIAGPASGTPSSVPSGVVPAGSPTLPGELLVNQLTINPGEFVTALLDTTFVDPSFSDLDATVALGHEHQLPPVVGGTTEYWYVGSSDPAARLTQGSGLSAGSIAALTGGAIAVAGAVAAGSYYARKRWLL